MAIDRESGDYNTYRVWLVVPDEELYEFGRQLTLDEVQEKDPSKQLGDFYEEEIESVSFWTRIGTEESACGTCL